VSQVGIGMQEEAAHVRRGRRATLVALLLVVGMLLGLFLGGRYLLGRLFAGPEDFPGPGTGEVVVEVEAGDSATAIGRTLEAEGVVASTAAFRDVAAADTRSSSIQPGFYAMREQMRAADALALMLDPASRVEAQVTVPEGLPLPRILDILAESTDIPREDFAAVLAQPESLDLPAWTGGNPDGVLFPATYTVAPDADAADVLDLMVRRFEQAAAETGLEAGSATFTPYELLTIASLIEAEAPAEAMPEVSRVIHNRIAQSMRLQLDSTVNYATGKTGITTTEQDRATDSPYNTYASDGLPPGPINSPGAAAMAAARTPAEGRWLYFVTVNPDTGETRFAETPEEHQANVEEFRAWLAAQETGEEPDEGSGGGSGG
jgi:UPF0755 protein